uniref:Tectonin beta-propeller repeat containing 2 n=1 Tax=Astyanax mexicanus TaxID=7994 RepID=A0A8B9LQJ7_ASTMX
MASHPPSIPLREFCPLYYLLNAIPAKVQKGFRSVLVYLTALDSNNDFIAVGSSIGMLYLYCRRVSQMNKYNLEGKSEAITVVKLLSCFDDLVAVGTASGRVALFQLVSQLPGRNKQVRIQELVVKQVKLKKKGKRRRQGECRGECQLTTAGLLIIFSCSTVVNKTLAESWMGYSGPGCGILSLVVTDRHVWCLDFKGGLYCSGLPNGGLSWQKFEENVQQVALSPSGSLLWKVEQKTMTAYACGKVTIKGKRHWYKALDETAFVALSDDTAWIIRTSGDLYLQTGLSVDRPCARAVKVDCPCPMAQMAARGSVVWALSEQRALFYREGLSSYCAEGEQWKYDKVSENQGLEPICIALGENNTLWALDTIGSLWFRTGITTKKPQGEDEHWWQVSITDYVVFEQSGLFQTLIQATQSVATATKAPVERVAERLRVAFLSQQSQCQPSLVSANNSGVWIASGRNDFHVAKGSLVGTFWRTIVPRGTASATKWAFVFSSAVPGKEGSFLWLGQSRKDLFCIWDQDLQMRPLTVQLPPDLEMVQLSACRDALWGLDNHGRVHIRTLSPSCPTGMHWTPLDLSQLGRLRLISFSCGSQNVWACDTSGMVHFRVGTQPLNPSMMLPAWICIEPPEQPVGVHLVRVQTSPNDRMLWALDSRGNVHVRTGITEEMPVGTAWEHIPGLQASQLVLSTRTAWVRCHNGEVARRYGISEKNPAGDYWKKVPGLVNCSPTHDPSSKLIWFFFKWNFYSRRSRTIVHTINHKSNPQSRLLCI